MITIEANAIAKITGAAVRHHRDRLGLSLAALSRRLTKIGRDIAVLGLRNVEDGERRCDVDDLVALAIALEVSPITLLMPVDATRGEVVPGLRLTGKEYWNWLNATYPVGGSVLAFYEHALPQWERDDVEGKLGVVR